MAHSGMVLNNSDNKIVSFTGADYVNFAAELKKKSFLSLGYC
jgi:hypothetical protein